MGIANSNSTRGQHRTAGEPPPGQKCAEPNSFEKHGEDTFFRSFTADLDNAKHHIIIQSPFIAFRRFELWKPVLERAAARSVRMCAFLKVPDNWDMRNSQSAPQNIVAELQRAQELLAALHQLGMHINLRTKIHAKLAVIDDTILWEGSLNTLSHRDTSEETTRWINRAVLVDVASRHKLDTCNDCWSEQRTQSAASADGQAKYVALTMLLANQRRTMGLSQVELARLSGVHTSSICRMEAGTQNIAGQTLVQISATMGLELVPVPGMLRSAVENLIANKLREVSPMNKIV